MNELFQRLYCSLSENINAQNTGYVNVTKYNRKIRSQK